MTKLHQIWVGPKRRPVYWMDTWVKKNPKMNHCLWTSYSGFHYEDKIQMFMDRGQYAIAADIMRVEILLKEGGVYIDADSTCLEPIQDAPFINDDFFACWDYTGWVANGVIGAIPNHPIIREYHERIDEKDDYWEFGARMLTACIGDKDVTILPTCTFFPQDQKGNKAPVLGKIYAEQYWASTKGLYAATSLHR